MSKRVSSKPDKAYRSPEFLSSPDARIVRILSEYLEPQRRFRQLDLKDTIVFYGSARACDPETADRELASAKRDIDTDGGNTQDKMERAVVQAEAACTLARYYDDARELAFRMTEWAMAMKNGRHYVVCSGGGPGIMEAANRGADEAGGKSVGLNISLPFEQAPNGYIPEDLNFEFHYFFMRKFWFVYLAKALVVFPGGFGTCDELFELLTLVQTKKVVKDLPIVVYGTDYWNEVLNLDAMVKWGTINAEDLDLIKFVDSPDDAFDYLTTKLEA